MSGVCGRKWTVGVVAVGYWDLAGGASFGVYFPWEVDAVTSCHDILRLCLPIAGTSHLVLRLPSRIGRAGAHRCLSHRTTERWVYPGRLLT